MKITVADHAQKRHTHDAQDKVYYVLKGAGRFSLAPPPTRSPPGEE